MPFHGRITLQSGNSLSGNAGAVNAQSVRGQPSCTGDQPAIASARELAEQLRKAAAIAIVIRDVRFARDIRTMKRNDARLVPLFDKR